METRLLGIYATALLTMIALASAYCGDGKTDLYEQCDDGNIVDGDGCSSICQIEGDSFPVVVYKGSVPTPALEQLPLLSQISQHGITWSFSEPARVGRFVNGDYYVVGTVTIAAIEPLPTPSNGRHGSMLNIQPNKQKSGFDSRISSGRYDASLRVYPPITLTPGNKLVSSRSADANLPCVMRGYDKSVSPVASVSILTSVNAPQPLDAFRPSYALGQNQIHLSRNLERSILPSLPHVENTAPLEEFEGYMKRPWVDSVFFNFDVAAEYQASYGRENGYMMSFAGLLLTLDFAAEEKEPLLVYMVQYGLDLYGLVEAGHSGWHAHGGHGTGRKFPILLAGLMLNHEGMQNPQANFGEDMQTIWVNQTLPAGTYQQTWHSAPQIAAYGGHIGLDGESYRSGWGPYEHLPPSQWKETLGEGYRRCCTSVSWIGEALAARLIPGMMQSWDHPQFFHYADRWMMTPDLQEDLDRMASEAGYSVSGDFRQQQSWKILSGGGYYQPHRTFVDEMWAAYRDYSAPACAELGGSCCADGLACSGMQRHASDCEICCVGECQLCGNGVCDGPENCSTCPEDCGACQAVCGNGICEGGETCSSCPQDCGACVCVHPAEKEPCDGCLDTAELLAYVRLWKTEGAAMAELMQAIRIWKQGC